VKTLLITYIFPTVSVNNVNYIAILAKAFSRALHSQPRALLGGWQPVWAWQWTSRCQHSLAWNCAQLAHSVASSFCYRQFNRIWASHYRDGSE